ncbi:MAG: methylenetetrahydrofolate reductase [NAD(P)H] [Gammaproteobacteria bacterium]|nr:methylenetetrahydrofolate reductase [NAD(P)H] [Gammaproteobacteria bacterium]MBQ0840891.1 methylenetetrahydrofolate reductase [NAD(P)H] [Gammaproteobacteria bacterium]
MARDWLLSFEFFPPKTQPGAEKLARTRETLATLAPEYFSVTYGAGGSTRDNTRDIVLETRAAGLDVMPHLSFAFGDDDANAIRALLKTYSQAGVSRLLALRGDLPSDPESTRKPIHANELVAFIREHFGDQFALQVAAYPEIHPDAKSYQDDIYWLGEKFKAGADSAITQYFFNIDAYWYFLDQAAKAGIDKPIVPGIMPITNFTSLARFSASCGAEIPRWMAKKLEQYGDDQASISAFGSDVVTQLCERLLEGGAPGLHFYTMNQAEPSVDILSRLGVSADQS